MRPLFLNNAVSLFVGRLYSTSVAAGPHKPTIYALSTAPGRAALGVIRLSGPRSKLILQRLTRTNFDPKPRLASLRRLYSPTVSSAGSATEILDDALTIFFPGPRSYTGEDIVELHVHGGRAVIAAVLRAIASYGQDPALDSGNDGDVAPAVRYAEPGEFTMRAFTNSRLDLTQVEGVGGMIDAETEAQRVAAAASAGGYMRRVYNGWQSELLEISGLMAAIIDFSEEGYFDEQMSDTGVDSDIFADSVAKVRGLLERIRRHVEQIERSEILLGGIKLALLGPPNAGKSSLLNALARRDAAIVSDIPGTTRDVVEVGLELGGYKVVLTDTAGVRGSLTAADAIEAQGIVRARQKSAEADVVVVVVPAIVENAEWHASVRRELQDVCSGKRDPLVLVAVNKIDRLEESEEVLEGVLQRYAREFGVARGNVFGISCTHEIGLSELTERFAASFSTLLYGDGEEWTTAESSAPVGASARVKEIITQEVVPGLTRFLENARLDDVVIASEEIRYAAECVGRITGESMNVEDVLGVVFSRFCVGK
ncbi:GTP-binding protein TrmE N-terminus-domain-containing protein [Myxozyma melibiosi]|uniref:GTP-binding protein TrmE N-terminus-domain-containing protein n=1 Tax=Myxozyma melibiosi TaxID=54550 RepID=A0ABR1F412_9ASCO